MKKYTEALNIMLRHVAVKEILNGDVTYNTFGKSAFVLLANSYHSNYSNDEIENLYTYFVDEMNLQKSRLFGAESAEDAKTLNVFELILQFAENVLLEEGDTPVCAYSKLLRWRTTAHILDEDTFLASFLAYRDFLRPGSRRDLRWNLVTGSNNISLRQLIEKGIAENHFHLKGSSPYFHLSWISMMNDIDNPHFAWILTQYDNRRLSRKINYNPRYGEDSLCFMCMQAALIRLTLYMWLDGQRFVLGKCGVDAGYVKTFFDYDILKKKVWEKGELLGRLKGEFGDYKQISCSDLLMGGTRNLNIPKKEYEERYTADLIFNVLGNFQIREEFLGAFQDKITLADIVEAVMTEYREIPLRCVKGLIPEKIYLEFEERGTLDVIHKILRQPDMMVNYQRELQDLIQIQRWKQSVKNEDGKMLDYAIPNEYSGKDGGYTEGSHTSMGEAYSARNAKNVITGERWILYKMFRGYYENKTGYSVYMNLFYAYLVIKETIRSELIQVNAAIGFSNFSYYESRKEDFIEGTPFEGYLLKLAVWDIMKDKNIRSLEARISPKMSAALNASGIQKNDRQMELTEDEKKRMFYVYHFVKAPGKPEETESEILCRHASLRKTVKIQAQAFAKMREDYPETASRILGLDACNAEISCRPEVFAQAFRFLRNHIVQGAEVPILGVTYHVGEDFLDIIDGLRAIDEVCRFLDFKCGDRLGHALVLGIGVEEWYDSKDRRIFLTKQAYLDNIVWLYTKIREIGLVGYEDLLLYIEKEYWTLFHDIYLKNIKDSYVVGVLKRHNSNEPSRFAQFSITTYYDN